MSALTALLGNTLRAVLPALVGTTVLFNGVEYTLINSEQVSGQLAGEQGVPREGLGPDIASTAPRLFVFDPKDFTPFTDVYPPTNGDLLVWCGLEWRVTHPDVENMSDDTLEVLIYALRKIGPL